MGVSDLDEWLRPDALHDEVTLAVDDAATGLVLRASLVVTPDGRQAQVAVTLDGAEARSTAEEAGPPTANWDRMRIGGIEWRMVEVLRRWELVADDTGLQAYLAFAGSATCEPRPDGYEQLGTVSGQLQLGARRISVTDAPARRRRAWR